MQITTWDDLSWIGCCENACQIAGVCNRNECLRVPGIRQFLSRFRNGSDCWERICGIIAVAVKTSNLYRLMSTLRVDLRWNPVGIASISGYLKLRKKLLLNSFTLTKPKIRVINLPFLTSTKSINKLNFINSFSPNLGCWLFSEHVHDIILVSDANLG